MKFKCIQTPTGFFADGAFTVGKEYEADEVEFCAPPDLRLLDDDGARQYEHLYFFEPADDEAKELLESSNYNRDEWYGHPLLSAKMGGAE